MITLPDPDSSAMRDVVTWMIGLFAGVLISAVGGSWYVSTAIAEGNRKAVQEAREEADRHYAAREDLAVVVTKLEMVIALQRQIIQRLDERDE